MSNYSTFERSIARVLEKTPKIKQFIKTLYQNICYIRYKSKHKVVVNSLCDILRVQDYSFWGYYDKSPNFSNNYLCHKFELFPDVRKHPEINIQLNGINVSKTNTWNWQQGAMCTWISDNEFIHNFFYNGSYKSKVVNIESHSERIIDFPIYAISKDGSFSISLNFRRLAKLRPDYGYFNLPFDDIEKIDPRDGLYFIDLINNTRKLIISFDTLVKFQPRREMDGAWHKVNHIELSPDNKRFIFHHRWFDMQGRKWSRLISSNIDGSDLFILSDDTMVSHCCWRNNEEIVGWMRKKELGDHYYLLKDKTDYFEIIGKDILKEDGHPSFSADGRYMITDTYPDKARMQHLFLFDMKTKLNYELGSFFSPLKYNGEIRCDLHPRFSPGRDEITFDSVFLGNRGLYRIEISKLLKEVNNE